MSAPHPTLLPSARSFLDALAAAGGPPIYTLSPADAREVLRGAQAGPIDKEPADVRELDVAAPDGAPLSLRIVTPPGATGPLPVVLYIHGGGWVLGDATTHDRLVRALAVKSGAAVVFVNYPPSPEARYPVAIEQAYAALRWVAERGADHGLDGTRLAIAGDSVGGNMTAAVTLLAKRRGGPKIAFQVLFYPVTHAAFDTGSYEQFAEGYFLTREAMRWFWDQYTTDPAERAEPTASPLLAPLDELRGLPPALVITGECDVLRDEGEAYAGRLIEAGVEVTATRYLGITHDFVMLHALADSTAARAAIDQAAAALRTALAR